MTHNNTGAAPASRFRGNALACLDSMPTPLRRAIHEGVVCWDPLRARWNLNKRIKAGEAHADAIAAEVEEIREADQYEVLTFAHHWPARFGRLTPHVRAKATILRYDEAARVREARNA